MAKLTAHFTLEELTHSDVANKHGLPNTPGPAELERLLFLAESVLEPMRSALGPIQVNCAYRGSKVNELVGGRPNSQHLYGEAADIKPLHCSLEKGMNWLIDNVDFDQVILEAKTWIHVSTTRRRSNRKMQLAGEYKNGIMAYGPYLR